MPKERLSFLSSLLFRFGESAREEEERDEEDDEKALGINESSLDGVRSSPPFSWASSISPVAAKISDCKAGMMSVAVPRQKHRMPETSGASAMEKRL